MSILTLADAKSHLNITTADDDILIQNKINAASEWIDLYTGTSYGIDAPCIDENGSPIPDGTSWPSSALQEACRQLVAHLYQNREASLVGVTAQALPLGFLDLLAPYRAYAF